MTDLKQYLLPLLAQENIALSERKIQLLEDHWQEVWETNQVMNLTSITESAESAEKHYLDCLLINQYLPKQGKCLDLGTGAGFPGMVLAIVNPCQWFLLDSVEKKCNFLRNTADKLHLENVTVLKSRAEDAAQDKKLREKMNVVTARAVVNLPVLLEYTLPFLKIGGKLVAMKGPNVEEEIDGSKQALKILGGKILDKISYTLPSGDRRTVVIVKKIAATPGMYPRQAGTPSKKPL